MVLSWAFFLLKENPWQRQKQNICYHWQDMTEPMKILDQTEVTADDQSNMENKMEGFNEKWERFQS